MVEMAIYRNRRYVPCRVNGEEYVSVLRDKFLEFREAFRKEPFI
jgi:hypothetical protein